MSDIKPEKQAWVCRVIAYLQQFATQRKLDYKQDSTGNMVIKRPGSGGGEAAPTVVIQVNSLLTRLSCQF